VLLIVIVLAPTYPPALAGLGVALALLLASRIPPAFVLIHLRWVMAFCAFLTAMLALTGGGTALWSAGWIAVSREGLRLGGLISIRAIAAAILVFPMIGTAPFHVSLRAMRRLRAPQVAVQILAFSYRYVFVLFDELGRMLSAARIRGLHGAGLRRRLGVTGSILGMLMIRSFDRTSRIHRAMISRGYRGEIKTLDSFRLLPADLLKGAAAIAVAAGLLLAGMVT